GSRAEQSSKKLCLLIAEYLVERTATPRRLQVPFAQLIGYALDLFVKIGKDLLSVSVPNRHRADPGADHTENGLMEVGCQRLDRAGGGHGSEEAKDNGMVPARPVAAVGEGPGELIDSGRTPAPSGSQRQELFSHLAAGLTNSGWADSCTQDFVGPLHG